MGVSYVISTLTSCPDPICQAQVDENLQRERLRREKIINMVESKNRYKSEKKKEVKGLFTK